MWSDIEMYSNKITAIMTDLDGCLWSGSLAEKEDIILNYKYYSYLKKLYKKGIQLFVITKNDIGDVYRAFNDLGISKNIFTHIVANWEPKYLSINKLLQQTKILPETVIFIDDNILELNEVSRKVKLVKCISIDTWEYVLNTSYFNDLEEQQITEIQERINRYRSSIKSFELRRDFREDKGFLKALNRKIAIGEISSKKEIERFGKLLALTHRINFNPEKFENINAALSFLRIKDTRKYKMIGVSVWESDLSLGLSGGFLVNIQDETAVIEDATFSCGIIGRDFEQKALLELIRCLKEKGLKRLIVFVKMTSTNIRVKKILNELEFKKIKIDKNVVKFCLDIDKYNPINNYEWISVIEKPLFAEHLGIPSVIDYFDRYVWPLIINSKSVINLGAANSEVLGLLQEERRNVFNNVIKNKQIKFVKVDLDELPGDNNIVADAENLNGIVSDEAFDIVMAIELLEHTEHYWKVIDEMIRICKIGGYIFITVPTNDYPKHEYPIDLWRIGPKTLISFFSNEIFEIVKYSEEGDSKCPRRLMLIVKKIKNIDICHHMPENGKVDWVSGITYYD
jgi:FkbH-like protein